MWADLKGPLDLLLALARSQQVDLSKISILALADQYLNFIDQARGLKIEIAADYLVMAAWLAYLKSRLLCRSRRPMRSRRPPILPPISPSACSTLRPSVRPARG
jgi:chromatin segregation and condensation protein Rec8/ScpA/Scc1 (kleisin family)